ncbi:NAD(P)H-hydrate dehydratase [Zobellella maritima]|uniref:NAD(P)H-hydrate dehydratase n=1 Tax=Zobellella maritima TaxID=2059725 RepID=UPI000E3071F2|nr:NAD(P)H-hydrate dehydratase [Zobellella maritima]
MGAIGLENGHSLTHSLWRSEQIRIGERQAAGAAGIQMYELMCRAGLAVFELARNRWPEAQHWWIFVGGGNNGGDGYVVARLARAAGIRVQLVQQGDAEALRGDAARARDQYRADGGAIESVGALQGQPDLVIDALLGIGLKGELRQEAKGIIHQINRLGAPVLAVDLPSGLCADTGRLLGGAVSASLTLTFVGLKPGLLTGQGRDVCGDILLADLGIQSHLGQVPVADLLQWDEWRQRLPRRRVSAHKGQVGRLLVLGGNRGMSGAIRLAGEAALRCGTGLVRLVSHRQHYRLLNMTRPELMTAWYPDFDHWTWAHALVIGPGMGQDAWGRSLWQASLTYSGPRVVDADGLHLLAHTGGGSEERGCWVLTPHPGEAASLLGCSVAEIEADRLTAVNRLREQYGAVVVLKGAGTLVADESGVSLCHYGNPGMASGGMGDLLSGIIGALLAQGMAAGQAARLGVCLHGRAGDLASTHGMVGMLASDLLPGIRRLINQVEEDDNKTVDH